MKRPAWKVSLYCLLHLRGALLFFLLLFLVFLLNPLATWEVEFFFFNVQKDASDEMEGVRGGKTNAA